MTTPAVRVKALLDAHGHSLRHNRTGLTKSTLQRVLDGTAGNLEKWLPQIAAAYGVPVESLKGTRDPSTDFEWNVRRSSLHERFQMITATEQERVRDALDFILKLYADRLSDAQIAAASGLTPDQLRLLRSRWDVLPPDLATTRALAVGVHHLTGISRRWFLYGLLDDESGLSLAAAAIPKAASLAKEGKGGRTGRIREVQEMIRRRLAQRSV